MKKILHIFSCVILFLTVRLNCQTSNIDFELTPVGIYTTSNAVSGWTVSSQTAVGNCTSSNVWTPGSAEFSIVSTPITTFPIIGNILASPLGGSNIARLNNSTANTSSTRLSSSFTVTNSTSALYCAFAGIWESNGTHTCCDQTSFVMRLTVNQTSTFPCLTYSFVTAGANCINGSTAFSFTPTGDKWTNWQVKYFDLSPFIGSLVTLEIITNDCTVGDHFGSLFLDTKVASTYLPLNFINAPICTLYYSPDPVNLCPGASQAMITAPYGYLYQWIAPGNIPVTGPQGTMQTLVTSSITSGSVYTVNLSNTSSGCSFANTYTISNSTVNISALAASVSCIQGANGSAVVAGNGSGTGYNYSWINPSNFIVGTASVVNNLAPGNYTVNISAIGSPACGNATGTVNIGIAPQSLHSLVKPYCGNEAYLHNTGGSNFQWYNGTVAIPSGQGGTASSYTITSPVNNSTYNVSFLSTQGCQDSIQYTLVSSPPGSLTISYNKIVCPTATNGLVIVSITPAAGSPPGLNSYSVFSTGTTTAYNATLYPTALNTFSASGLTAGGNYSVNAFDGFCKYTTSFSVTPFIFNYTATPLSATVCLGNSIPATVTFTSPPSFAQYSYSWSPSTFMFGATSMNAIITCGAPSGSAITSIYSVVVTPSVANCPLTKTISITMANPVTATITPIVPICSNTSPFNLTINPTGGNFINGTSPSIDTTSGVLTPSLASIGINTFTYANSLGTCSAKSSGTFMVNPAPTLTISGNSAICQGQSTSLLASGATTFTWSNLSNSPFITVSPFVTNNYTVIGLNLNTNCSNSKNITVTVVSFPTVTVSGHTVICIGESSTLTANGANSYQWSNGFFSQTYVVSPIVTSTYTIIATNTLASCSTTQAISVIVTNCDLTGIEKQNSKDEFTIYPNPTNGKLYLEIQRDTYLTLRDGHGKLILENKMQKGNHFLDLSDYSIDFYFITFNRGSCYEVIKVLKTN